MTPSAIDKSWATLSKSAPLPTNRGVSPAADRAATNSSILGGVPVAAPDKITPSAKPRSMVSRTATAN